MGIDRPRTGKERMVFLLLVSLATAFAFQGSRGLFETSEGRYAECAREMVESGNYMEPTLGYRPHWTKPPVTYWVIAAGIRMFGSSEWAVRFFHALALVATVGMLYWIGRTAWDAHTGWIAACIYATSPLAVFGAFTLTTDALLTLWEVAAAGCFVRAAVEKDIQRSRCWIHAMWGFFGLGFLTKGPPALLPLLPLLAWRLLSGRRFPVATVLGLGLFGFVGFSWYLLVTARNPDLFGYFIGEEILGRIRSNQVHNPEWYKPFTLYLPVIVFAIGPWLYGWIRGLRTPWKNPFRRFVEDLRLSGFASLMVLWIALPLLIFSMVKSRLPLYLLPLTAPLALLSARGICRDRSKAVTRRRVGWIALLTAALLVGLKGGAAYIPHSDNMAQLHSFLKAFSDDRPLRVASFVGGKKLYGLQYYLNGNLQRLTWNGEETYADASLGKYLKSLPISGSSAFSTMVVHPKYDKELQLILARYRVSFQEAEGRFWNLYHVSAEPAAETILFRKAGS